MGCGVSNVARGAKPKPGKGEELCVDRKKLDRAAMCGSFYCEKGT